MRNDVIIIIVVNLKSYLCFPVFSSFFLNPAFISLPPPAQILLETIKVVQGWQTVWSTGKRITGLLPPATIMKAFSLEGANSENVS